MALWPLRCCWKERLERHPLGLARSGLQCPWKIGPQKRSQDSASTKQELEVEEEQV